MRCAHDVVMTILNDQVKSNQDGSNRMVYKVKKNKKNRTINYICFLKVTEKKKKKKAVSSFVSF